MKFWPCKNLEKAIYNEADSFPRFGETDLEIYRNSPYFYLKSKLIDYGIKKPYDTRIFNNVFHNSEYNLMEVFVCNFK